MHRVVAFFLILKFAFHFHPSYKASARCPFYQEYFYGLANDLSPHSNIANFSDLLVYRIGGGPQAPRSALPIGADPISNPLRVTPVNIDRDLLHMVLAVSYAKESDQILSRFVVASWNLRYILHLGD